VRKEAVLSSQIEGTQASFADVLGAERQLGDDSRREAVGEVSNYVKAMNWGLAELERFPLSLRLLRNIHDKLIRGTRGTNRNPGEFRMSQNWIGPAGCTPGNATFIPPSVPDMGKALGDLELYLHATDRLPALVKIALVHAQFETIHPFLDGNGRMGRLLITFWLCQQEILSKPLLYLSYYFKKNRREYYDRLMDVRKTGDWEEWIKFFLRGVAEVADEATSSAKAILKLQKDCAAKLQPLKQVAGYGLRLLDILFEQPFIQRKEIIQVLGISGPTATHVLDAFLKTGMLVDMSPGRIRNKLYVFSDYLAILNRGTELEEEEKQEPSHG
jgi:Fic family protein